MSSLFPEISRRHFLTTAAAAAGASLIPGNLLAQDPAVDVPKDGKAGREKVGWKARPFPMKQVRLGEGPCKAAMEADRQYLHSLPPDRLLQVLRSEEHTSELQSTDHLVCRLLLEKNHNYKPHFRYIEPRQAKHLSPKGRHPFI